MKKSLRILLCVLIACVVGMAYGLNYLRMEFADSANYTEQDSLDYDFYTPDLLKKMPRITDNYSFYYSNVSGPNPALIFQLRFIGATNADKINAFMKEKGFKQSEACSFAGDCWTGDDPHVTVSIEIEEQPRKVLVSMVDKRI